MKHILYKTICKPTGEYYFGIHSSRNRDAWYLGSGKNIKDRIRQFGKSEFFREDLQEFSTRTEAEDAETEIIQQHWKQKGCLNIRTSSKGWFCDRSDEERADIGRKISASMLTSKRVKDAAALRKGKPLTGIIDPSTMRILHEKNQKLSEQML